MRPRSTQRAAITEPVQITEPMAALASWVGLPTVVVLARTRIAAPPVVGVVVCVG